MDGCCWTIFRFMTRFHSQTNMADPNHRIFNANQNNLSSIKSRTKKEGMQNIFLGAGLFVLGVPLTIYLYLTSNPSLYVRLAAGVVIAGIVTFSFGVAQLTRTKDALEMDRRKSNKKAYGVEEPDQTWECPNCKTINPNTAYTCQKCKYKLLE